MLVESATDIDATDAGELEWELNLGVFGARSRGALTSLASVEAEWRVLHEVGLRLEPSFVEARGASPSGEQRSFGIGGALAFGLLHDFPRDQHLQLELLGRSPDPARAFDPSETELPLALDFVGARRVGMWTFRATVGAEAGGAFATLPLHTDVALLKGILPDERYGFVALEARADWARKAPLVLAPEIVAILTRVGLPIRLGVSLPFHMNVRATAPSYGLLLRLSLLTEREAQN